MKFRIELEEAISIMEESVIEIDETEKISLEEADGMVLADDIYAPFNNPPFDRSPLDGYAVISKDTKKATRNNPVKLKVIDEIFAGSFSNKKLKSKEAVRIMTGAKLPNGCDAVIKQENTNEGIDTVEIYEEVKKYDNYCFEGEDTKKGDFLMKKGETLSYIHIGILSGIGYAKIKVKRKVKVALLVTGDEVCIPGTSLNEGKIYDSNMHLLNARLKELGISVIICEVIGDDYKAVGNRIKELIDSSDMVITTGGVSVGKKDIIHEVLSYIGAEKIYWKVNLKPGTPAMFSLYNGKPILSLSGNPFASLATFELLVRPVLAKMSGKRELNTKRVSAFMESDFNKSSKVRRFVRAYYENGKVKLKTEKHSSGILSSMIGCNALIDIKEGTEKLSVGDRVNVILI